MQLRLYPNRALRHDVAQRLACEQELDVDKRLDSGVEAEPEPDEPLV
jgi:hypothetical protein